MANIKSAEKRIKQSLKRRDRNRVVRGGTRTAVKKARTLIDAGDAAAAEAVQSAIVALDRSVSKGIIHKNNAARRKSRLVRALNKATA
ncbi:MAG: 30S ribosomal protein S20 [Caldilineaceae bacterium]|nr:30S ribosomal protein S20 [Caldilineaceae bacterium]MCB0096492.1 30S ribosomal protein S20 [Caldilineaceae bacterium]MCB0142602.1 30S ribosomal protein S20 [Caldilineaceae bacterium]MCB9149789.1 30S ribosomal protein S20 [Caldilineaceae bacterium]MCB9155736.1 30S ribosomal protein S20 [Caldilineaceae bacterium]